MAPAPHGKYAKQEAHAKGDPDGRVGTRANGLVRCPGSGNSPFFKAFPDLFGFLYPALQSRSKVSLFVIFSCCCIHTYLVFAAVVFTFRQPASVAFRMLCRRSRCGGG